MSLYIKSVQSYLLRNLLEISTIHIAQCIENTILQDMNMVKTAVTICT